MYHFKKSGICFSLLTLFFSFSAYGNNFNYYQLKIGAGVYNGANGCEAAPVMFLGKRYELEDSAIEISVGFANTKHNNNKFSYYSLPKITYVQFYEPGANSGFYYGGGLSFSQQKYSSNNYDDAYKFSGLFAEGTVGYEFKRNAAICPIVYLDISQGVLAESKKGKQPGPAVMAGLSLGFM